MKRKVYCDYLRLIATFAVVFIHVAASNWSNVDVNGIQWQVFNIYDSLVRWGVPNFAETRSNARMISSSVASGLP